MSFNSQQPHSLVQFLAKRFIGRIPVYEDEFGEYAFATMKIWHPRTRETEDFVVKVDANIEAIREASSLILRSSTEITKGKAQKDCGTLGFLVHKNSGKASLAGDTSLPLNLFGNEYHYARNTRDDKIDFRKTAFTPAVKHK